MSTLPLVDPETRPLLELMPTRRFGMGDIPMVREVSEQRFAFLGPPPLAPQVVTIAGPGGPLDLYIYDPEPRREGRGALLHIHGGGMIMGSARTMQHGPSAVAASTGTLVASVEYRLAPEHPFPAPQDDCLAALEWLAGAGSEWAFDPARLGLIGESAGGGLAAATALMARDRNGPVLAAQFLTYPMLDHRTGSDQCPYANPATGEFIWTREANQVGWAALQGRYQPVDHRKGWFSPALADDLAGLPPTWIGTGSLDLFLDENLDFARRLTAAAVPVELHSYPGAIHAFSAVPGSRLTQAYARDLMSAVARWL